MILSERYFQRRQMFSYQIVIMLIYTKKAKNVVLYHSTDRPLYF